MAPPVYFGGAPAELYLGSRALKACIGGRPLFEVSVLAPESTISPRPAGWESFPVQQVVGGTAGVERFSGRGGDLRLQLPRDRVVGPISVSNVRNLVVIGGEIQALPTPQGQRQGTIEGNDQRLLQVFGASGTVYFERLLGIGAVDGAETDFIVVNDLRADVCIVNCRVEGLRGTKTFNHADVFQTYDGVRSLTIDGLSASSNYQGIKCELVSDTSRISFLNFNRVNIDGNINAPSSVTIDGGGYYLWLDSRGIVKTRLRDFWILPRGSRSRGESAWPGITNKEVPANRMILNGSVATWPLGMQIDGQVNFGTPPDGDWVPRNAAGRQFAY